MIDWWESQTWDGTLSADDHFIFGSHKLHFDPARVIVRPNMTTIHSFHDSLPRFMAIVLPQI